MLWLCVFCDGTWWGQDKGGRLLPRPPHTSHSRCPERLGARPLPPSQAQALLPSPEPLPPDPRPPGQRPPSPYSTSSPGRQRPGWSWGGESSVGVEGAPSRRWGGIQGEVRLSSVGAVREPRAGGGVRVCGRGLTSSSGLCPQALMLQPLWEDKSQPPALPSPTLPTAPEPFSRVTGRSARVSRLKKLSCLPSSTKNSREGLPWWLSGKESACRHRDMGLIPGLGGFHIPWSN